MPGRPPRAAAQRDVLARLAFQGRPRSSPSTSTSRTFNGFATPLDARTLAIADRYPGRAWGCFRCGRRSRPRSTPEASTTSCGYWPGGRRPDVGIPGLLRAQASCGVARQGRRHSCTRTCRGAPDPGLDVLDPGGDASAEQNPTAAGAARAARHRAGGPRRRRRAGPTGSTASRRAPSVLPIRVAGWQPDADGGVSVYGRTDQVLAGLERGRRPERGR